MPSDNGVPPGGLHSNFALRRLGCARQYCCRYGFACVVCMHWCRLGSEYLAPWTGRFMDGGEHGMIWAGRFISYYSRVGIRAGRFVCFVLTLERCSERGGS